MGSPGRQTPGYRGTLDRRPRHSHVQHALLLLLLLLLLHSEPERTKLVQRITTHCVYWAAEEEEKEFLQRIKLLTRMPRVCAIERSYPHITSFHSITMISFVPGSESEVAYAEFDKLSISRCYEGVGGKESERDIDWESQGLGERNK